MSNVLFVTTPERAEKLRPNADGPTQPGNNVVPFPNGGLNPPPGGFGLPGFGGVVPAIPVPPAPAPAEAPKVEEKKEEPEKKP
jgi:hypothetical protein